MKMSKLSFLKMDKLSGLVVIGILAVLVATNGCKPKPTDEPTPEEAQTTKLSRSWTANKVTFNGTEDRSADWSGFTLTVAADGKYSTSNAFSPGPWPASGTWAFAADGSAVNINKVVRDDGLEISISVSDTDLTLTFIFNDAVNNGGRVDAVNGEYVFEMN
ncbi:MAG: hypothetical protein OEX02_15570 [Cyclobacteriaceae bacterium]|nr:hypothetical protein [Cyclobacteriaceae bacterium]